MIRLNNLTLAYDRILLDNVNIHFPTNQISALIGESGSGKSSLLYEITFIEEQASYTYLYNSKNISNYSKKEKELFRKECISFVSQGMQLIDSLNIIENIEFFCYLNHIEYNHNLTLKYLEEFDLHIDLESKITDISGGQKQRLAIICALMKDTPVLIMDEPSSYLDYDNIQILKRVLVILRDKYRKTIIIATHDEELYDICDCIYKISQCKIDNIKKSISEKEMGLDESLQTSDKLLTSFIKPYFKKNKKFFIILMLLSTLIGSFGFIIFSSQFILERNRTEFINSHSTSQIIVDNLMYENTSVAIERSSHVDRIYQISPIVSDEGYYVWPYFSEDYFNSHIYQEYNSGNTFANFGSYRETQADNIVLSFDDNIYTFSINTYMDSTFLEPMSSNGKKTIYVPYSSYIELRDLSNSSNESTVLFVLLDDKENSINFLYELEDIADSQQEEMINIINHENTLNILEKYNSSINFNDGAILAIYALVCITMLAMIVYDSIITQKAMGILQIHGISTNQCMKILYKKWILVYFLPIFLIFFIIIGYCMYHGNIHYHYALIYGASYTLLVITLIYVMFIIVKRFVTLGKIVKSNKVGI